MQYINKYFADLTHKQDSQFTKLGELYAYWNSRINVISRKDIEHLYLHHTLHSLSIAKIIRFNTGTRIMDAGTGGGFPGIPLAILFPDVEFTLVDSIEKKTRVVASITEELELKNCRVTCDRIENVNDRFDFIISRAVTTLPVFLSWVDRKMKKDNFNELNNGILYLKGGDLSEELSGIGFHHRIYNIHDFYAEPYFETKKVVYIDLTSKRSK